MSTGSRPAGRGSPCPKGPARPTPKALDFLRPPRRRHAGARDQARRHPLSTGNCRRRLADKGGLAQRRHATLVRRFHRNGDADASVTASGRRPPPINEPWCVGWLSHFDGAHAPGLRDIRATGAGDASHPGQPRPQHRGDARPGHGQSGCRVQFRMGHVGQRRPRGYRRRRPLRTRSTTVSSSVASSRGEYPAEVLGGLGPHLPRRLAGRFRGDPRAPRLAGR